MAEGIRIDNLVKTYGQGDTAVHALRGVNMWVAKGEVVGLIGPSGSGKSTLLKCLGAVIEPTSGRMTIGDRVIYDDGWKVGDLRALRRDLIGFIFQAPYLIPFLDVTDNVALLPMLAGKPNAEARKEARDATIEIRFTDGRRVTRVIPKDDVEMVLGVVSKSVGAVSARRLQEKTK